MDSNTIQIYSRLVFTSQDHTHTHTHTRSQTVAMIADRTASQQTI